MDPGVSDGWWRLHFKSWRRRRRRRPQRHLTVTVIQQTVMPWRENVWCIACLGRHVSYGLPSWLLCLMLLVFLCLRHDPQKSFALGAWCRMLYSSLQWWWLYYSRTQLLLSSVISCPSMLCSLPPHGSFLFILQMGPWAFNLQEHNPSIKSWITNAKLFRQIQVWV